MSVLIWLVVLLFGLGGFMSTDDAVESGVEVMPAPSATAVPEAGEPLTDREIQDRLYSGSPLPACGVADTADKATAQEGWTCLQEAVGGDKGAELIVHDVAVDIDGTVVTHYRVQPDGSLEIFVQRGVSDEATWEYRRCRPSQDLRTEPCAS